MKRKFQSDLDFMAASGSSWALSASRWKRAVSQTLGIGDVAEEAQGNALAPMVPPELWSCLKAQPWCVGFQPETQPSLFLRRQEFVLFLPVRPCKLQLGASFTFCAGAVLVAHPFCAGTGNAATREKVLGCQIVNRGCHQL